MIKKEKHASNSNQKKKKKKPMGVAIWVACFDTNQLVKTREGW